MNKQTFLKNLEKELRRLKKSECKKYIDYYDEIISDIMDKGVSEEEAIKRQGDVKSITDEILSNVNPKELKLFDLKGLLLAILSVIMILICAIPDAFTNLFNVQMNSSVSIIGGADGPTSIFIAGKIGAPTWMYVITAIVIVLTAIYWIKRIRQRNRS